MMLSKTKSRYCRLLLAFGLIACVASIGFAQAPTLYVIGGPGVSLSADDVRDVFLGEKLFSGSTKLTPVANRVGIETFLSKVVGISAVKLQAVWSNKNFRDGVTPPRLLSSDTEVIEFVKRTPGAVGYVSTASAAVTVIKAY
jgi:hypothetical protein